MLQTIGIILREQSYDLLGKTEEQLKEILSRRYRIVTDVEGLVEGKTVVGTKIRIHRIPMKGDPIEVKKSWGYD